MIHLAFVLLCAFDCLLLSVADTKAKRFGGAEDVLPTVVKSQPFSPQVVFQCGYKNRYVSRDGSGQWTTDKDQHASCLTGKLDILKYCRKVYPDLQITNIVESSHYYDVTNWCKLGGNSCKSSFWVKPYRCVVGAFESEALLVPESCHFGHVDERQVCNDFDYWNKTAHSECEKRPTTSFVRSFAMLDPCGLDVFSGVEFVCCPDRLPATTTKSESAAADKSDTSGIRMDVKVAFDKHQQVFDDDEEDESSDEDDEDEYDEDDDFADDKTTTARSRSLSSPAAINRPKMTKKNMKKATVTTTKSTTTITLDDEESDEYDEDDEEDSESIEDAAADDGDQDPYFRVADPDREHDEYTAALERLEKRHRQKVAKVMKEWAELESRFQEMKEKDPNRADKFRGEMTSRFQRTVAALEEENRDERRQIEEVHQQRVNAFLNERIRETIQAFRDALSAPNPQSSKVLRTLQAYIRAEEKDRLHALNRYRRFLRKDPDAAAVMKAGLVRKMSDVDARINATIQMLHDAPQIEAKVKPAILDFWKTFRKEHTPDFIDGTPALETNGRGGDDFDLVEAYKKQYKQQLQRQGDNEAMALEKPLLMGGTDEKQRVIPFDGIPPIEREDEDDPDDKQIVKPVVVDAGDFDSFLTADEKESSRSRGYVEQEDVKQSHAFALKETIQHNVAVKEEEVAHPHSGTVGYVVFGVASVGLLVAMMVAIVAVKRYYSIRGQGFVKVDPCTPEERHVAAMQVNGYENPTYKYFDDKP